MALFHIAAIEDAGLENERIPAWGWYGDVNNVIRAMATSGFDVNPPLIEAPPNRYGLVYTDTSTSHYILDTWKGPGRSWKSKRDTIVESLAVFQERIACANGDLEEIWDVEGSPEEEFVTAEESETAFYSPPATT